MYESNFVFYKLFAGALRKNTQITQISTPNYNGFVWASILRNSKKKNTRFYQCQNAISYGSVATPPKRVKNKNSPLTTPS